MHLGGCLPLMSHGGTPSPTAEEKEARRQQEKQNRRIEKGLSQDRRRELSCLKLLLLGTGESGKSTIIKQMKIIHIDGFTEEEKLDYIPLIKRNVRDAIVAIIAAMQNLGIPFENSSNESKRQILIHEAFNPEFTYPPYFFDFVQELWQDSGVQACYQRSNEYQLIDSAKYFLDRLDVIRSPEYIPSQQDILRCRKMTDAISEITFQIRQRKGNSVNFKVFDVGGQKGERKKWIQLFDSVTAILFVADCSSYDLTLREDRSKSRLIDAMEVFQQTWLNKYLQSVPILVFLNKIDLLQEKVLVGRYICDYLPSLNPLRPTESKEAQTDGITSFGNGKATIPSQNPLKPPQPPALNGAVPGASRDAPCPPSLLLARSNTQPIANPSPAPVTSRRSFLSTVASTAPVTSPAYARAVDIFQRIPFDEYMPNENENREFLNSFPLDEGGRTINSMKGHRTKSRDLPNVHRETIRTACYIKNIFTEITKERASPYTNNLSRERKSLFFYTCAVNTDNIQKVLDGCRVFLMEEHLEKFGIL